MDTVLSAPCCTKPSAHYATLIIPPRPDQASSRPASFFSFANVCRVVTAFLARVLTARKRSKSVSCVFCCRLASFWPHADFSKFEKTSASQQSTPASQHASQPCPWRLEDMDSWATV